MKARLMGRKNYNDMRYEQEQLVMEKFPWHKQSVFPRKDDNEETMDERIRFFFESLEGLRAHY